MSEPFDRAGSVTIISGPPGSGKTTVAGALASEVELGVHLESDWFFRSIRSGFIGPHLPESHLQNTAVIDVATDAAAGYASSGYAVFWDGVVGPWFLDRVARRLTARGVRVRYLVLRPRRAIALDRVRTRDGTAETSGAEVMFEQFSDLGEFESHVINGEGTPEAVLRRCRGALDDDALLVDRDAWVDDRWSVSVKGVLVWGDRVVVLRNRRGEWELPGGRLDRTDNDAPAALRREMSEELGLSVTVGELIDSWIYDVAAKRVLILTYRCDASEPAEPAHSAEHTEVAALTLRDLEAAVMPEGYRRSIRAVVGRS